MNLEQLKNEIADKPDVEKAIVLATKYVPVECLRPIIGIYSTWGAEDFQFDYGEPNDTPLTYAELRQRIAEAGVSNGN